MSFSQFRDRMQAHFSQMTENITHLFQTDVDPDVMWNLYLDSFPAGTNEIYRKRREFDCSCCRHFIKQFGNVVAINANNQLVSIWDFDAESTKYQPVINALSAYVKGHSICNVKHISTSAVGTHHSVDNVTNDLWSHFYLEIPRALVDRSSRSDGDYMGSYRSSRDVFQRSLEEISTDSINTVLELIAQNSLYRGEEWKNQLKDFLKYKNEYMLITDPNERQNYAWLLSGSIGPAITHIRNHSIGTLLVNISEGMDLEHAVRQYESIVAPANYKRPKAIFTQKMLEEAQKKIEDMGYMDSLGRRFATLDDITVNNILFSNRDAAKRVGGVNDVFAAMSAETTSKPKNFDRVEEISAEDFVKNVLPTAQEVEVYFENRHSSNMVSLIAPQNANAKSMFKWNNPFGWAYAGNVTDSIRENVKAAGGKVDGVLRFSIQWNDDGEYNRSDYDAHCVTPKSHIYFGDKKERHGSGMLDVDIINPIKDVAAVENITWPTVGSMGVGAYGFYVHGFSVRQGNKGFKAEIEADGEVYSFEYPYPLRQGENVDVAIVHLDRNGKFTVTPKLSSTQSSKQIWGLTTNHFVPVSVIMYSPNYWDQQDGIGNRHYFFMLKDCVNPETPNGFYNEFLNNELVEHKRVFEALGSRLRVQETPDQLSGIGFAFTKRNDLVVRVTGATKRTLKIKF